MQRDLLPTDCLMSTCKNIEVYDDTVSMVMTRGQHNPQTLLAMFLFGFHCKSAISQNIFPHWKENLNSKENLLNCGIEHLRKIWIREWRKFGNQYHIFLFSFSFNAPLTTYHYFRNFKFPWTTFRITSTTGEPSLMCSKENARVLSEDNTG